MEEEIVLWRGELTEYQKELLTKLIDEASEVIQACSKTLNFGPDNYHPSTMILNRDQISKEIGEFETISMMLLDVGILNKTKIVEGKLDKRTNVKRYIRSLPKHA